MVYKIFLVDDDRFLLDLYAVKFKNAGHEITTFASGEELLMTIRKNDAVTPDAILIDVIMPEMTGFETVEAIRKEGLVKGAKIIFLSNQGNESDFESAKSLHADGYIIKASAIPSEVFAEVMRTIEDPSASLLAQ